jgi:hypothetical protein
MKIDVAVLRNVLAKTTPEEAWAALFGYARSRFEFNGAICTAAQIANHDREIGKLDLLLSSAAWELWRSYNAVVPRTADQLVGWWQARPSGRAVLVLDGLSLRELPWLLAGANARGYVLHDVRATGAELPADTNAFAAALGAQSRASLNNNAKPGTFRLPGAYTDVTSLPFTDAAGTLPPATDLFLWHEWPDDRLHRLDVAGLALEQLAHEAKEKLQSDDFWSLVHKLTQGRRLIITADHGYAACGHFADVQDDAQAKWLRDRFKQQRFARPDEPVVDPWLPPLSVTLPVKGGDAAFVLGRRRWKVPGGYPTLTHGGLSLLEVAVPFIELSRPAGA